MMRIKNVALSEREVERATDKCTGEQPVFSHYITEGAIMKSRYSLSWQYSDADKEEIAQNLCEGCRHYVDGGGYDDAYGYRKYYCNMECIEETHPSEQDCPKHQEYLDIIGEDDEEDIEE